MMNYKEHVVGDDAFSSLGNASLEVVIPGIAAPIKGSKKTRLSDPSSYFDLSSSTAVYTFSRHMSEGNDFRYPSPVPHSEDTYDRVPRSGNKSPYGMSLSEYCLLALQSLQDPILSPSSSSFSLDEMFQQGEFLDINTDSIFSDHDSDGDWRLEEKLPLGHSYWEILPARMESSQSAKRCVVD